MEMVLRDDYTPSEVFDHTIALMLANGYRGMLILEDPITGRAYLSRFTGASNVLSNEIFETTSRRANEIAEEALRNRVDRADKQRQEMGAQEERIAKDSSDSKRRQIQYRHMARLSERLRHVEAQVEEALGQTGQSNTGSTEGTPSGEQPPEQGRETTRTQQRPQEQQTEQQNQQPNQQPNQQTSTMPRWITAVNENERYRLWQQEERDRQERERQTSQTRTGNQGAANWQELEASSRSQRPNLGTGGQGAEQEAEQGQGYSGL